MAENDFEFAAYLQQLITQAMSEDAKVRYRAANAVRRLIDSHPHLIDSLINSVMLPILIDSLRATNNHYLQCEAAFALRKIASGTSLQKQAVVEAGAIPVFIEILSSSHGYVCGQVVWALGYIIEDGPQLRDYVISLGVLKPLLNLIKPITPIRFVRHVTWIIMSLCKCKDPPPPEETLRDILPALNVLIHNADTIVYGNFRTVLKYTVWSISYLTEEGNDRIQMVVESGIVPKLVSLLSHEDDQVQTPTIRAVDNIVRGTNEHKEAVLNCDALKHFPNLLSHPKTYICNNALYALSYIAAGNHVQIQAVIDANLIPLIIHHLDKGELKVQKEAAWAVRNVMVNGTEEQVACLVNVGMIPPFCHLLNCEDEEVIGVVLEGVYDILLMSVGEQRRIVNSIFLECGGFRQILLLQDDERFPIVQAIASEIYLN